MRRRLGTAGYLTAKAAAPALALIVLAPLALAARVQTAWRRRRGAGPRLLWGPEPIISIKYWSGAMRSRGYESTTLVATVYPANSRQDFDRHRDEFLGEGPVAELVRDYVVFAWALLHADVFFSFFDGGYLRMTPLRDHEGRLLRLAGKRTVVLALRQRHRRASAIWGSPRSGCSRTIRSSPRPPAPSRPASTGSRAGRTWSSATTSSATCHEPT